MSDLQGMESGHAPVNGIQIYYQLHGRRDGVPLVLLHGGGSTIEVTFSRVLPVFAGSRRVIAVEEQGHGRTTDRDAPVTFESSADDVAGLLRYLKVDKADVFGFSNGASIALQIAIRHSELVRKLVFASSMTRRDGARPELWEFMKQADFSNMPQPLKDAFLRVNPDARQLRAMHDKDAARKPGSLATSTSGMPDAGAARWRLNFFAGCAAILAGCDPASVSGIDSSEGFVSQVRRRVGDQRARFVVGDAAQLPWRAAAWDVTVSGLVLNFVRDHAAMVREMARVTRPGGMVAAYVWDYGGGMQMMRHFWDAAVAVSPNDAKLDQAERFPLCQRGPLQALFERVGLQAVTVRAIQIPTVFENFDDYWVPFLGKTGAAPTYLASVNDDVRERIRLCLESRLAPTPGGRIELTAQAWAVRGVV